MNLSDSEREQLLAATRSRTVRAADVGRAKLISFGIFVAWQVTSFFLQARKTTAPHQLPPAHPEPKLAEE